MCVRECLAVGTSPPLLHLFLALRSPPLFLSPPLLFCVCGGGQAKHAAEFYKAQEAAEVERAAAVASVRAAAAAAHEPAALKVRECCGGSDFSAIAAPLRFVFAAWTLGHLLKWIDLLNYLLLPPPLPHLPTPRNF